MAQQETRPSFSLEDLEALVEGIGHHIQSFSEWLELPIARIQQFFRDLYEIPNQKATCADMPEWLYREIAYGSL